MRQNILLILVIVLISCKQKEATQAQYIQRAIQGNDYKMVLADFQRVQDSLNALKKHAVDSTVIIYEFNTMNGNRKIQAKTLAEVIKGMDYFNKDSLFLRNVQMHLADTLKKNHRDSVAQGK